MLEACVKSSIKLVSYEHGEEICKLKLFSNSFFLCQLDFLAFYKMNSLIYSSTKIIYMIKKKPLLTNAHPELIHPGSSLQETTVTATPGICTSSSGLPALTDTSRWYAPREVSFNSSHIVFTILSTSSSSCSTVTDKRSRTAETRLVGSRKNSTLGCKVLAVRLCRGSGAEWGEDMTMVPSTCGSANS